MKGWTENPTEDPAYTGYLRGRPFASRDPMPIRAIVVLVALIWVASLFLVGLTEPAMIFGLLGSFGLGALMREVKW